VRERRISQSQDNDPNLKARCASFEMKGWWVCVLYKAL